MGPKRQDSKPARVCECGEHSWVALSAGFVTLADPGDVAVLAMNWSTTMVPGQKPYAVKQLYGEMVLLARHLLGVISPTQVDHADLDSLNNRRGNLRPCTPGQNGANKDKRPHSRQPYKGVRVHSWGITARITVGGKTIHLGAFKTAEEARDAYNEAGRRLHGEFFRAA